jgi:hypothetical protein
MDYDNERDRHAQGYDAGTIVEGTVHFDANLYRHVIMDDDGKGFDPESVLAGLVGEKVRIVIVSFKAIENVEKLLQEAQDRPTIVKDKPLGDA